MPEWTEGHQRGVFDAVVFDNGVFDAIFMFEPGTVVDSTWTPESAGNKTWVEEDGVE